MSSSTDTPSRSRIALAAAALTLLLAPDAAAEPAGKAPPLKLAVEVVGSSGGVDHVAVEKAAAARLEPAKACFSKAIERGISPWGSVTLDLLVARSGRVHEANVTEDTLRDGRLGRCLVRRALEMRLPGSAFEVNARVQIAYRFNELRRRGGPSGPAHSKAGAAPGAGAPMRAKAAAASGRRAISRSVIQRSIRRHQREIQFCYESQLVQSPGLSGLVSVRFTITPAGSVSEASVVSSTLAHDPVETCLVRVVRRMEFPSSDGGEPVTVTYPFRFESTL